MKFETYAQKIAAIYQQEKFQEDPSTNARARVVNARTQYKTSTHTFTARACTSVFVTEYNLVVKILGVFSS